MSATRKRAADRKENVADSMTRGVDEIRKSTLTKSTLDSKGSCNYFRALSLGLVASILACSVYVYLLDCPYQIARFDLQPQPELVGALEPNTVLSTGKRIFVNELYGPESFAVDKNGDIYTGTGDGRIWRIDRTSEKVVEVTRFRSGMICNDESSPEELQMCSRPLGLHFHPNGLLYVADAYNGLYSVNVSSDVEGNKRKQLVWDINTDIIGGERTVLLNNMAFLKNGSILMTDTTTFKMHSIINDLVSLKPTGKLIIFTPGVDGGRTYNLVDRLHFANGLLLSEDESHILVAQTAAATIIKYYLKGPKAGMWDTFASNLPIMPDNLSYSKRGTVWVAGGLTRHPITDAMYKNVWIRKLICKLRISFFSILAQVPGYGLILELDPKDGHIIRGYHDPYGKVVTEVSEVLELDGDNVYLGSYKAPYLVKANLNL